MEQVEAVVVVPPVQVQPKTFPDQSDLHPSVLSVFPSSQTSDPKIRLSPQIGSQTDSPLNESKGQAHPISIRQALEHPSESLTFPSSQVSPVVINPSLHCSVQVSIVVLVPPAQCQPSTCPLQSPLHPVVPSVLPSSQDSPVTLSPSPQIGVHEEAPAVLVYPVMQLTQLVCAALLIVPAVQIVHIEAPAELTYPRLIIMI